MPIIGVRLMGIYLQLFRHYGPQHWWPAESRFEVIVGAILTQATSWGNVEKAMANLKAANVLDPSKLCNLSIADLARLIYPAGYFNVKAKKIKAFVAHLHEHYNNHLELLFSQDLALLRQELVSIYGIGPETADSIILYAAEKPIFVIDTYTRRLLSRLGLADRAKKYSQLQSLFMDNLPHKVRLFNEYHALIVKHTSSQCRRVPICSDCPLAHMCQVTAVSDII